MSLEAKSKELKDIMATYNSDWLLGDLYSLIHAGKDRARDQLGKLSSPLRQLYYLAGLNVTSDPVEVEDIMYNPEKWEQIVSLLNDIEVEYDKLFFPERPEDVTEEWKRVRIVAMPSFLTYFNQGPLNYEEQVINWIRDLYTPLDKIIEGATGLKTEDFIEFYDKLDRLRNINFQAHSTRKELLRPNWRDYTKIQMGTRESVPDFIREMSEQNRHIYTMMSDHGITDRFYPNELVSPNLPIEKVQNILNFLTVQRGQTEYLYYTATKPGNPLFEKPILDIGGGMYQVFEVKQVMHAISDLLERIYSANVKLTNKYVAQKGKLLEDKIEELFTRFLESDCKVFRSYYIDGCEQDILILWRKYAFIIEAKGYDLREPLRTPDRAFPRIKDDFKACIGYAYEQTRRVEKKFIDGAPLRITDHKGKLIEEIDTTKYEQDFSIIVNLETFGQIQCDLATLITLENDDDVFPWAIRLDDLEVFLLTIAARKKTPNDFVYFLTIRETLHGKLICNDELEICGGFLTGKLKKKDVERAGVVITTHDLSKVFDDQYRKGMGFKNERNLYEKKSGKYIFY